MRHEVLEIQNDTVKCWLKSLYQFLCKSSGLSNTSDTMNWYVICIYCIYSFHVITPLINSLLYSCVTYRQVKEMVNLNLFIDSHYKYIVSIIRVKHILTLHLSTANCRILTTTGCCCKNAAATQCSRYAIYFCLVESIPQFLELWPMPMHFRVRSSFTLLYRNATSYGIRCYIFCDTHWSNLRFIGLFFQNALVDHIGVYTMGFFRHIALTFYRTNSQTTNGLETT